ncbi:cysteine desulfurase family protein [Paenibacillus sp. DP01]|uniref:cysteine desulfurase family protein n=1 Tax=Paenibacillus sp. DP01 TaxID=3373096 RepID=UPI00384A92E5
MIYFDNSATTSIHPEVLEAMLPYLKEEYGNPSSRFYSLAENAKKAVEQAREQVADLLGCRPDEVIFTSGATESNNTIIKGIADYYGTAGKQLITTEVEHPSVLETIKYLETKGFSTKYLHPDKFGRVTASQLSDSIIEGETILASILWGNNEIGSLNDIDSLARVCDEKNIFFHTDATQVLGKVEIKLSKLPINFLSCSAHKIHGPKGVGACIIRKKLGLKTKLTPLLHGGGQENDYRSGTLSVHNIVGFGKAAEIANSNLHKNRAALFALEDVLFQQLTERFNDSVLFNNDAENKIPGLVSIQFKGTINELLIKKLAHEGFHLSSGSACSSTKPSHVLTSIGLSLSELRSTIRISLSPSNTEEEIHSLVETLSK